MSPRHLVWPALLLIPRLLAAQCPDGTPPPCGPRVAGVAPTSVAVLYFDNRSRDTADAYLADGLTEELISRLGQVERLQVKSRTAVLRYRDRVEDPAAMGRALGVAHLVSGSVQRAGDRLRVNVELTRAAAGVTVWTRIFDRPAGDLFAVQAEIAESVAVGVSGRLAPAERRRLETRPTTSAPAYDHYLRGNFETARRTAPALLRSVREYEAALRLDPRFAAAMVRAAVSYYLLYALYYDPALALPRDSVRGRAYALADRALRLDSTSAEAWRARALVAASRSEELAAYARAAALAPRDAEIQHVYGVFLRDASRDSAAAEQLRRALALEPERPITLLTLAQVSLSQRRYREALPLLDSAAAFRPDAPFYYLELGRTRLVLGDTAGARAAAQLAAERGNPSGRDVLLAMVEARAGDTVTARARVARVEAAMRDAECILSHACQELSWALAAAGMREEALAVFERLRPRDSWLLYWSRRAEYDPIRDDPRFAALLAEARRNTH